MPRGEVYGSTLTVGMEILATEHDAAVQRVTSMVEQIKQYLGLQRAALDPFNTSSPSRLLPLARDAAPAQASRRASSTGPSAVATPIRGEPRMRPFL